MPITGVATPRTLGSDLLAVVARLNRLATQRTRLPLPCAQARLLSTIEDHGEARISDLAALDHCSQPTMTTQVRRLEDAGLVSRTVDPGDARAVLIRITPEGRSTRCRRAGRPRRGHRPAIWNVSTPRTTADARDAVVARLRGAAARTQ